MKGVIMQKGDKKSAVLFNNGKFGSIPTPPHCEVGTVITVSYNSKRIIVLVSCVFALCIVLFFLARFLYFTPAGFLRLAYGGENEKGAVIELTYNRMERIRKIRPLTQNTVEIAAGLPVVNKDIFSGCEEVITVFLDSPDLPLQPALHIDVAQNNLSHAKDIALRLSLLSGAMPTGGITTALYTLELYQESLEKTANEQTMPAHGSRHRGMMHRWGWQ